MTARHADGSLQRFGSALDGAIRVAAAAATGESRRLADELALSLACIDWSVPVVGATDRAASPGFPAQRHWAAACTNASAGGPAMAGLAAALEGLAAHLHWYRRPEPDLASFMAGHANSVVVGPAGLIADERLLIGLTLMAPHTVYPDHHHPPQEGYVVLSAGQWRQAQGPWQTPGIGGWVYNPPDIVHAMRSGDQPLLAVWCLPLR